MEGALRILYFAQARIDAGCSESVQGLNESLTQEKFWAGQVSISPALAAHHKSARLARNGSYMLSGDLIHPGDEIAIIPPVSGG